MDDVAVFANAPQLTADALAVVLSGRLAWRVKTLSVERPCRSRGENTAKSLILIRSYIRKTQLPQRMHLSLPAEGRISRTFTSG